MYLSVGTVSQVSDVAHRPPVFFLFQRSVLKPECFLRNTLEIQVLKRMARLPKHLDSQGNKIYRRFS